MFLTDSFLKCCQAQPQLDSTQSQLKLRLRLALFPADPPTHRPPSYPPDHPATQPPGTVVSSLGVILTVSRPLDDHFKTTLRRTMTTLFQDYFKNFNYYIKTT